MSLGALVALVTGSGAASIATAAPPDSSDEGGPTAGAEDVSTGAYEVCSEDFGLGKVVEVVVEVAGAVPSPPLTYPADVQLVWEYDNGVEIQQCAPVVVTDELWALTFWGAISSGLIPAPEGNYVFLPAAGCDTEYTLRLVGAPAGYQVSVGEALVSITDNVLCDLDDEAELLAAALAAAEPLMSDAAFTALTSFTNAGFEGQGCNDDGTGTPNANLDAAWDALVAALEGPFDALYQGEADQEDCEKVQIALLIFLIQTTYEAEVGRQAVFELTIAPAPAVVIIPAFTG